MYSIKLKVSKNKMFQNVNTIHYSRQEIRKHCLSSWTNYYHIIMCILRLNPTLNNNLITKNKILSIIYYTKYLLIIIILALTYLSVVNVESYLWCSFVFTQFNYANFKLYSNNNVYCCEL